MQTLIYSKKYTLIIFFALFFALTGFVSSADKSGRSSNGMVVSADELASKIGLQILKKGGNAVDAAVATGFALAVTYPVAGNIGGGGFMVIHLKGGKNISIDYREKAPLNAFRDMYLDSAGNYLQGSSVQGITSAGVPGSVAGMIYALEKYGTMKLKDVLQPAINLAEDGFPLDYHTAESFSSYFNTFSKYPSTLKVFSNDGKKYLPGEIFKQPDLASTLKRIAEDGLEGFYAGRTAELIVAQMNGLITLEDLALYKPIERAPVEGTYREFNVLSMGPPSSGGVALIQLLNILENRTFSSAEWGSSRYIHFLSESMKYVYSDRAKYLGDPDFTNVPVKKLLSKEYAKDIFYLIRDDSSAVISQELISYNESLETTHYSVYDTYGNAVSTTTTINSGYGSKVVVEGAGFLLNNEMDDFSVKPGLPNQFGLTGSEANSIQPGKRMLSSMTPTIILKNNEPYLIVGSPGGSTIITVVLQVIMNVLEFRMNLKDAMDAPRIHHQLLPDQIDYEPFSLNEDTKLVLESKGQRIGDKKRLGLIEAILIDQQNNIIYGTSDKRGNGSAEGY